MVNLYFHPEMTVCQAVALARRLGCTLVWQGGRFVLRRVGRLDRDAFPRPPTQSPRRLA